MAVGSSACWRRAIFEDVSDSRFGCGPADGAALGGGWQGNLLHRHQGRHLEYLGATTNWGTSQATDRFQPGANLCLRLVPRREEPRFSARCEREECRLDEELQTELSDHSPGGFVQRPRRVSYVPRGPFPPSCKLLFFVTNRLSALQTLTIFWLMCRPWLRGSRPKGELAQRNTVTHPFSAIPITLNHIA
jgi:hypothetical protein